MLDIYKYGDEVLYEPTSEVKEFDDALKLLIDAMFETMDAADGVGLAGPQVGVSKRIFVVDDHNPGGRLAFINPVIADTSEEMVEMEEGCLSIPGFYADVRRPKSVTVQAFDVNGKPFTVKADGFIARIIQHENDHLYKKLFIDHLDPLERTELLKRYQKQQKRNNKH